MARLAAASAEESMSSSSNEAGLDDSTIKSAAIMSSSDSNEAEKKTPWDKKTKEKFESKQFSEYYDPCQEAASRSIRCLHRNGGDKDMCQDYFQAYRDCKKEWLAKRKEERRAKGLSWT